MNAPSVGTVFEPLEPLIVGREVESSKHYFVSPRIGGQYGRVKLPSALKALGAFRSNLFCSRNKCCLANHLGSEMKRDALSSLQDPPAQPRLLSA